MTQIEAKRFPKADALFENLVSLPEFQALCQRWLRREIKRDTLYRWIKQGLPSERICGERYFPAEEAALWIKRTKGNGSLQIS